MDHVLIKTEFTFQQTLYVGQRAFAMNQVFHYNIRLSNAF